MHRIIMKAKRGQKIDHINGDGLNNQRHNLRFASTAQNGWNRSQQRNNSSGFKGVYLDKRYVRLGHPRTWLAYIVVNGRRINIGYSHTAKEAARIRDAATLKYHGDFGVLNFPNVTPDFNQRVED